MPKPYGTHPVIIPATGTPTCDGIVLQTRHLGEWCRADDDYHLQHHRHRHPRYDRTVIFSGRAVRDGHLLCLRPTATEPAAVGLTPTQFADASLRADFTARALVVDPYDADGNDIRERPGWVSGHMQQAVESAEAGDVLNFIDRQDDLSTRLMLLGC